MTRDSGEEDGLSYDEAKRRAGDPDPAVRREAAGRSDLAPELLYFLAGDPDSQVRQAAAANRATPGRAHLILARDQDDAVRGELAEKVGRLFPELAREEQQRTRDAAADVLERLAGDQVPTVRRVVSDVLKDVADAPEAVIRQLAGDSDESVAVPVLEHSPVLSDDDLLEIIKSTPGTRSLSAISRRESVSAGVSDAIVATADEHAITDLLNNGGAQIREETLDALAEEAAHTPAWRKPLVRRPRLSARATVRLAQCVADSLVKELLSRQDIDDRTARAVGRVVRQRLEARASGEGASGAEGDADWQGALARGTEKAVRLYATGGLTPRAVLDAVSRGDTAFATAALGVLSGAGGRAADAVLASGTAEAVVALAWKAGLPAVQAPQIQALLGRIPPDRLLQPTPGGHYPLGPREMEWQLELFAEEAEDDTA